MHPTTPLRQAALDWVIRPRPLLLSPRPDGNTFPGRRMRPEPAPVVLRGARASDAAPLAAMHSRCSLDTVFRRYHSVVPVVSAALQARLLTTTVALVAVDNRGAVRALGNVAELSDGHGQLAVLVEDAWQGRGLGTTIAKHLAASARLAGFADLRIELLPSSEAAARVAGKLGPAVVRVNAALVTFTLRLRVESLTGLAVA